MKANELRTGNLINDAIKGYVVVVTVQEIKLIQNPIHAMQLKPIPLTPEWLATLKFKEVRAHVWMKGDFGLEYFAYEGQYFSDNIEHINQLPIEYVHQLQNLYFALTGEELI